MKIWKLGKERARKKGDIVDLERKGRLRVGWIDKARGMERCAEDKGRREEGDYGGLRMGKGRKCFGRYGGGSVI